MKTIAQDIYWNEKLDIPVILDDTGNNWYCIIDLVFLKEDDLTKLLVRAKNYLNSKKLQSLKDEAERLKGLEESFKAAGDKDWYRGYNKALQTLEDFQTKLIDDCFDDANSEKFKIFSGDKRKEIFKRYMVGYSKSEKE